MKILLLTYYSLGTAYHALNLFLHFSLPLPHSLSLLSLLPLASLFHLSFPLVFTGLRTLSPTHTADKRIQTATEKVGIDSVICQGLFLGESKEKKERRKRDFRLEPPDLALVLSVSG